MIVKNVQVPYGHVEMKTHLLVARVLISKSQKHVQLIVATQSKQRLREPMMVVQTSIHVNVKSLIQLQ